MNKLKEGFITLKRLVISAALLCYLVLIALCGANLLQLAYFLFCIFAYIFLPGLLFVKVLKLNLAYPKAQIPLAILCGTGFFAVLYCICMRLNIIIALKIIPFVLSAIYIAILFKSIKQKNDKPIMKPQISKSDAHNYLLLFSILLVLFAFSCSVKNSHPAVVGETLLNSDLLWNVGNANSFKIQFPPQDIRFSEVRLAYHYLTELVVGALSIVSGVSAFDIFAFFIAPVFLGALLVCLYNLGMCYFKCDSIKTFAFVFSVFVFNCISSIGALTNGRGLFWNTNLTHLITNINSQSTGLIFISIFFILFIHLARTGFDKSPIAICVFLCASVMMCFAKGPAAAIVTCSFCVTMLFLFFKKPKLVKAIFSLASVIGIFIIVYFGVFSAGVNASVRFGFKTMEFTIFDGILNMAQDKSSIIYALALVVFIVIQIFCMVPVQTMLWAQGLKRDVLSIHKMSPERMLANGVAFGGILAFFLFWHPSFSQLYFVLVAIFFLNILAVENYYNIKSQFAKKAVKIVAIIALSTTAVLCINFVGSGARQLARNYDIIPKYPYKEVVTASDEAAANWLNENLQKDQIFATNRIGSDGISNIYSALSARGAYMEGYTYAITNMGVSEAVVQEKKANNAALFSNETAPDQVLAIAQKCNIDYLVLSCKAEYGTNQLSDSELVYQNSDVKIYKINKG